MRENGRNIRACPEIWIRPGVEKELQKTNVLIFDVDRTMADIRSSYEDSIRGTAAYTLKLMGIKNIDECRLATETDLYPLWQRPELADVWYLTYAVTAYYQLQQLARNPEVLGKISDLPKLPIGNLGERINADFDAERSNLASAKKLLPLSEISYTFSEFVPFLLRAPGEDKVSVIENAAQLLCDENGWDQQEIINALGNIWSLNFLKSTFQQMFMDEETYRAEYGIPFIPCRIDWENDKTTIPLEELKSILSGNGKIGIATARPRSELNNFLRQFGLIDFFIPQAVMPLEEGSKDERIEKSILALSREKNLKNVYAVYIGDTTGDINAVRALQRKGYNILVISVGVNPTQQALKEQSYNTLVATTDVYIDSLSALPRVLPKKGAKL